MIDEAKVEVLKVWYSVFCVLMDGPDQYTEGQRLRKLRHLRQLLRDAYPQLESELKKN